MARGIYIARAEAQAVSTAITLLEITAPSTAVLELIEAELSTDANTDAVNRVQLLRKTATITSAASAPAAAGLGAEGSSGVTVKWKATAEGTDGNVMGGGYFHLKNGWNWAAVKQQQRILVPPSGIIALKFPATPANANWTFAITWEEIG